MVRGDTWSNAIVGAVVTVVLSFLPFSPALGGGVAAYLQGEDTGEGVRVGALSGAIAAIPLALIFLFLGGLLALLPLGLAAGDVGVAFSGAAFLLVLVMLVFALVFSVAYTVGFGALGGVVGAYVAREYDGGSASGGAETQIETE